VVSTTSPNFKTSSQPRYRRLRDPTWRCGQLYCYELFEGVIKIPVQYWFKNWLIIDLDVSMQNDWKR